MIETLTSPSVKRALVLYTAHRRAATSRDRNKKKIKNRNRGRRAQFSLVELRTKKTRTQICFK